MYLIMQSDNNFARRENRTHDVAYSNVIFNIFVNYEHSVYKRFYYTNNNILYYNNIIMTTTLSRGSNLFIIIIVATANTITTIYYSYRKDYSIYVISRFIYSCLIYVVLYPI